MDYSFFEKLGIQESKGKEISIMLWAWEDVGHLQNWKEGRQSGSRRPSSPRFIGNLTGPARVWHASVVFPSVLQPIPEKTVKHLLCSPCPGYSASRDWQGWLLFVINFQVVATWRGFSWPPELIIATFSLPMKLLSCGISLMTPGRHGWSSLLFYELYYPE